MNAPPDATWPVLVVDDDPDIQILTAALLDGFEFEQRPLELISADSAHTAETILKQRGDIAVVLLDIAMETETAGLDLAAAIRGRIGNPLVRIILRTARPDRAPPRETVASYEIDAYHAKTELNPERLFTQLTAALRSYRSFRELSQQRDALARTLRERDALEIQLRQAQKLEAVGRLGAGIAHEINTPVQFVSDNCHFARTSFEELRHLRKTQTGLFETALKRHPDAAALRYQWQQAEQDIDLAFLDSELDQALQRSLDGLQRIGDIVRAMRDFSHPGQQQTSMADINRLIRSTLTVAASELRTTAEVDIRLEELPALPCFPGQLNQALLNMVINAAQAMREGGPTPGQLQIRSWAEADAICIAIRDTGPGIPGDIRERIFDPFFTTKEVGQGSGQGLAIAYNVIVKLHGGELRLLPEPDGAHFLIRLPRAGPPQMEASEQTLQ